MTDEQMEVLNITQEVLKALTTTLLALNPEAIPRIAPALRAFANAADTSPMAKQMLGQLAQGVEVIAAARPSQK